MTYGFSKENQSAANASYSFGDFEFSAHERQLMRLGTSVPLQPKAFDALLLLVRRAGHLVSKQELIRELWPSVHVSEANLTNIIVSLRKAVGPEAIQTVSKHGYRFTLPVTGEPGIARLTYERFVRARELTAQRSVESMSLARELYWTCLAEDPTFAPGWVWLGRCCWFLAKFGASQSTNAELAQAAFQRAFVLDSDLGIAHQFYTLMQADTGHAHDAALRLLERLSRHPGEPESLAGLVHVFRFRGLLDLSLEAHKRTIELDPTVITSVAHTWFLMGEYAAAIETYSGRAAYYLDAASWAALGENKRAMTLLRERLSGVSLSALMKALMGSLLALLEGRTQDAVEEMSAADTSYDPEILVYFARHYACAGLIDAALSALQQAAERGFLCASSTLESDPWLEPVREHSGFTALLEGAKSAQAKLSAEYRILSFAP